MTTRVPSTIRRAGWHRFQPPGKKQNTGNMAMLGSFISDDVYRVMLGACERAVLACVLADHQLFAEGELRKMRRDDGSGIWVAVTLVDGATLERIGLRQSLSLMQVDNISARLRAGPSLPGEVSPPP